MYEEFCPPGHIWTLPFVNVSVYQFREGVERDVEDFSDTGHFATVQASESTLDHGDLKVTVAATWRVRVSDVLLGQLLPGRQRPTSFSWRQPGVARAPAAILPMEEQDGAMFKERSARKKRVAKSEVSTFMRDRSNVVHSV